MRFAAVIRQKDAPAQAPQPNLELPFPDELAGGAKPEPQPQEVPLDQRVREAGEW